MAADSIDRALANLRRDCPTGSTVRARYLRESVTHEGVVTLEALIVPPSARPLIGALCGDGQVRLFSRSDLMRASVADRRARKDSLRRG